MNEQNISYVDFVRSLKADGTSQDCIQTLGKKDLRATPCQDVDRILKAIDSLTTDSNLKNAVRLTGKEASRFRGANAALSAL